MLTITAAAADELQAKKKGGPRPALRMIDGK
jgi:hypothetical protein